MRAWRFVSSAVCLLTSVLGAGLFAIPAKASSPLDERIAELEAITARKNGRTASIQIYGQVNRALLIWDDGFDSDTYVVDNDTSSTRLGLIGKVRMKPGWDAGYRVEIELKDAASDEVSNVDGNDEGFGEANQIRTRHAYWFIDSEQFGRLSLGQQSPATDDITIINLGARMSDAALHYNNGFAIRIASPGVFNMTWGDLAHTVDAFRGDFVRYDTPILNGFLISAAWGENDVMDAAIRFQKDFGLIQFAAGAGAMQHGELEFSDVRGSASLLHKTSGLYASVAGGLRQDEDLEIDTGKDSFFHFTQIGVKQRLLSYGDTTFYGEYGFYNNFSVGKVFEANLTGAAFRKWAITDAEVSRYGFGLEQAFDEAALLLYSQYHQYEADFSGARCGEAVGTAGCTLDGTRRDFAGETWSSVVVGARVQF